MNRHEIASNATQVLVVDDHELAREGLKDLLADEMDIEVIGEATNGREAVSLCGSLKPELLMMDVRMPQLDGLEATRIIKEKHPDISVLIMTMHENQEYLLEALRAGAAGYVLKGAPKAQVVGAIRKVMSGESPLDQELAARLLRRLAAEESQISGTFRTAVATRDVNVPLTPRELEVVGLLKLGMTNRQIAQELVISVGTAKNHVEHIITKLGVSDRTQAVVRSLEIGLLQLTH